MRRAISGWRRWVQRMACCGQPAVCSRTTSRNVVDNSGVRSSLRFRPPPFFGAYPPSPLPLCPGRPVLVGSSCYRSQTTARCTAGPHAPTCQTPPPRTGDDPFPIVADRIPSFAALRLPGNSPRCIPFAVFRTTKQASGMPERTVKTGSYFVGVPMSNRPRAGSAQTQIVMVFCVALQHNDIHQ
jgi:hypothetical protein